MNHHILMVTSKFVPQQTPLDTEDFFAIQLCLQAQDGLVFYNGGPAAGASVEHKQLQMIPLPLSADESTFPFDELFSSSVVTDSPIESSLPFAHRVITSRFTNTSSIEKLRAVAKINYQNYHRLIDGLKLSIGNNGMMASHNMLVTRNYL